MPKCPCCSDVCEVVCDVEYKDIYYCYKCEAYWYSTEVKWDKDDDSETRTQTKEV